MGAAVPTGNGSEVEITVRPVDALARVNDALWERLDAFNAGYTGDTSTDEGYAAYDAAWAEDALALFEEGTRLMKKCTTQLDKAEQKVSKLLAGPDGKPVEEPFEGEG